MLAPRNVGPERDKRGRGPTAPLAGLALGGQGAASQEVCRVAPRQGNTQMASQAGDVSVQIPWEAGAKWH